MDLIQRAIKDRYLVINQKKDTVIYLPQGKERKYSNPEEQVEIETYVELIYKYGYPPEKMIVYDKLKIGSSTREADIIVYKDKDCKDPFIIVECKKRNISDRVFEEAVDQGFSYAAVTNAEYVWATSGDRSAMYEVWHDAIQERESNKLSRLPQHKEMTRRGFSLRRSWRWIVRHPVLTDTLLYLLVLTVATVAAAKLAVEYFPTIHQYTRPLWDRHGMDFNWIFNAIVLTSTLVTLGFGALFMRSHQIFRTSQSRKLLTYLLIAVILFLPVWYIGESNSDPNWWKWINYEKYTDKGIPSLVYLWPYIKSIPFQIPMIYGLIWLMNRRN
ncbi:MAG: hypothetical protein OHK0039_28490 [Bacteroidia bacterium]